VLSVVHVPLTRTWTDDGATPVVSRKWTVNVKVVAVVPVPGATLPSLIVTVPQVLASTGTTLVPRTSAAASTNEPVNARARPKDAAGKHWNRPGTTIPSVGWS
jgi:hypothetical protein